MIKRVLSLVFALLLLAVPALAAPSPWAEVEVANAIKAGLVPERIQDNYQQAITREEFCEAVMLLYESFGGKVSVTENPFADTQNPKVAAAYGAKIVEGMGEGLFAPENNITRQEICTMLKRCVVSAKPETFIADSFPNSFPDEADIADWAIDGVKYINMLEVMLGDDAARINPLQNTTREQAILLIYRLYNDFTETFDWISAYYGFVTSGNTSSNMLGGSFAVVALDNALYISDANGITVVSESGESKLVTSSRALAIYPDTNNKVFYISADDGKIYVSENGTEKAITNEKADKFLISGNKLYFRGTDDKALYCVSTDGGQSEKTAEGPCSMPIPSGSTLYYSDKSGIVSKDNKTGDTTYVYEGTVNDLVYENSTFFFTDGNGVLYTLTNTQGNSPKVLVSGSVEKYCVYENAVIYVSGGSIYKRDLNKRFNIKLGEYQGESFNSYKDTVYMKDLNGKIFKFNPKTLEKTPLN
ncbi:MAG: DUF5050 domain-containing protein [Clostridia bacterium]|nr:DUF5050 domain-containing protein [Clostridia bacterium]